MHKLTMLNGREYVAHVIFATEFETAGFTGYADRHIGKTWPSVARCTGGYVMDDGELVTEPSYLVPFEADATLTTLANMVHGQESVLVLSEVYQKPQLRRAALRFIDSTSLSATLKSLVDDSADLDLGFMQELPGVDASDDYACTQVAHKYGGFTILDGRVFVASKEVF